MALGTTLRETKLLLHLLSLITKTCPKSKLVLFYVNFAVVLSQLAQLTQLALWPNSNSVPGTLLIICLDSLPPRGHALVTSACDDGNGGGGPALATDAHRDDNKNGDVWGGPAPVLGKETSCGMDMAAEAAADDDEGCHKQEA